MFGIGFYSAYSAYTFDFLGGINASLIAALFIRLLVGIGWYRLFDLAGKEGYFAFIPFLGSYTAFRLVWDDFSFAAIFSATTFLAFVNAVGVDFGIINACAVINFIMWWFMALLTARAYRVSMVLGFLYGGIPWLGVILLSFWPSARYIGPWSSDPEADQNLSSKELKKRRKREAKEAKKASK